jgi:hypothetical protein
MVTQQNKFSLEAEQARRPALSLILCSRNDQYMGNSRWRLTTALNYVAKNIQELGREDDVEVLVADWGSEIPLREVVQLSPAAARLVSFIVIPPEIARSLQKDSPFAEVLALNAAARRARGEYIGRVDQDTLVGKHFFEVFFELYEGRQQLEIPLNSTLLFSNVRMIPYRFAVRCPSLPVVARFVGLFGRLVPRENSRSHSPFYFAGVGIWLLHRDLWSECGGYDERMIYMNAMETNMIIRLMKKYQMVNLGKLTDYDFYHLEHYQPWVIRKTSTHRKVNPHLPFSQPDALHPNGESWGLREYPLQVAAAKSSPDGTTLRNSAFQLLSFIVVMLRVEPLIILDTVGLSAKRTYETWRHRAVLAWGAVYGMPILSWPRLLKKLWTEKRFARQGL